MADAKKALSVSMYCHAEQPRILHSLNLANVAVGKVSDYRKFLVKKPGQNVTTEIAHDGESIVNPSEILSKTQKIKSTNYTSIHDNLGQRVEGLEGVITEYSTQKGDLN